MNHAFFGLSQATLAPLFLNLFANLSQRESNIHDFIGNYPYFPHSDPLIFCQNTPFSTIPMKSYEFMLT